MKNNKTLLTKIFCYVRNILALVGLILIIYHSFFKITIVYSDSMAPTLKGTATTPRDYVLVEKISYLFRKPRRWEIIKYTTDDELYTNVMKRIVALDGETISIEDNWVCIDGEPLERPTELDFLKYYGVGELHRDREVKCDGGYFMLGDDSMDSYDSRFTGIVTPDRFEGRAMMIIWPPSRIRML